MPCNFFPFFYGRVLPGPPRAPEDALGQQDVATRLRLPRPFSAKSPPIPPLYPLQFLAIDLFSRLCRTAQRIVETLTNDFSLFKVDFILNVRSNMLLYV